MNGKFDCNCSKDYDTLHEAYHELNTKLLDALLQCTELSEANKKLSRMVDSSSDHVNVAKKWMDKALEELKEFSIRINANKNFSTRVHIYPEDEFVLITATNTLTNALAELNAIRDTDSWQVTIQASNVVKTETFDLIPDKK